MRYGLEIPYTARENSIAVIPALRKGLGTRCRMTGLLSASEER